MSRRGYVRVRDELLDLCESSDDLSFDALQEIINSLGPHERVSSQTQLCFHLACSNTNVTLKMVQLLHNAFPGALQLRADDDGSLPIHHLCCNDDLDDTTSLEILRFMLEIDPTLPREVDDDNDLAIHLAVTNTSTAFCKELIGAHRESLRIESGRGGLPIHRACAYGNRYDKADTIQYMLELDTELINAEYRDGRLPIHLAAINGNTNAVEMLLNFDPNAASKEVNDGSRPLPLHLASYKSNLSSIQVLYDAYPEAILINRAGSTPIDLARKQPTIEFLQTQLEYARQAQDMTVMTTLDENGQLLLHHALKENVPLGSIKLLVRGNPAAVQVSDQNGAYPVHIACEFSSVKVVKYLVDLAGGTLNSIDAENNSPLHYACHGGNCGVVECLLKNNVPSVSERNNDNKLAIHLLFECGENVRDRESTKFVETVWLLLSANPEVVRGFMPC